MVGKIDLNEWGITTGWDCGKQDKITWTVTTTSASNQTTVTWADALAGVAGLGSAALSGAATAISYPATKYGVYNWYQPTPALSAQVLQYNTMLSNFYQQALGGSWYKQCWPMETVETAEERAAREARYEKRAAAELAQKEAAKLRAEGLLFTILTPDQVRGYKDDDYFDVPVGERLYRLRKGRSMNVELIEAGKAKIKYCAHPSDAHDVPVPDVMLSQMLMLRSNEAEFLRIANKQVLQ